MEEEEYNLKINEYIDNIKKIRDEEFEKHKYTYTEYVKKEKIHKEKRIETMEHQKKMRKQALINKNKSANKDIQEYETINENEKDLLTDELFYVKALVEEKTDEKKKIKKKFEDITREELLILLERYYLKKKIKLNKEDLSIWTTMKNDEEVEWRKYLSITQDGSEINKISFFKKNVFGDDIVDFTEEEKMTAAERKVQEKRRKILSKF